MGPETRPNRRCAPPISSGRARAILAVLTALSAMGCGDDAALIVDLKTDLVPGVEFDRVRVRGLGSRGEQVTMVAQGEDFTGGRRIAEFGGLPLDHSVRFTVDLLGSTASLSRPVSVKIAAERVGVTVLVTRDCRGIECPVVGGDANEAACLAGRCVDPACSPESPERCPEPDCTDAAGCIPDADCAEGICESGFCFYRDNGTSCDDGYYCNPEEGCRPSGSGSPDGGPPVMDAGSDAGSDGGVSSDGGHDATIALPDAGGCTMTGCPGDMDCDKLTDVRDPEPTVCNHLYLDADFPGGATPLLTLTGGAWTSTDDLLRFTDVTMSGSATTVAPLSEGDYIVEARVVFREVGASPWRVGIRFRDQTPAQIGCSLFFDDTLVPQSGPHMSLVTAAGGMDANYSPSYDIPVAPTNVFFLHARVRGTEDAYCGFWDASPRERAWLTIGPAPAAPGLVGIDVQNARVDIDYLRVWALR